jgi:UDP-N-acetylglucosamine:LPS N-acetylglucosamine transferase
LDLPKKWDIIAVLSGPEPQRTILEKIIIKQVSQLPYKILLIQGKPEIKVEVWKFGSLEVIPFLNAEDLNEAMAASDVVICRAGYSTIMDLAVLGKKAILIPTPGQTEQEYLAQRFFEKGIFYTQKQAELNLPEALKKIQLFTGLHYSYSQKILKNTINTILSK